MYLGALLMDLMCFLVFFAALYGTGGAQMSDAHRAWIGAGMQLTYMPFSFIVSRILTRRNARPILLVGTVGATCAGVAALFCQGFAALLVLFLAMGMFAAFFFNSFQTFMRGEAPPGGLNEAVANYTVAWSVGIALGFLLSGSGYSLGPGALAGMTVAAGIVILMSVFLRRARPHDEASADEHVEQGPEGSRPVDSRYVIVGWIMIFGACFVQRPIQTFFPAWCKEQGIGPFLAALPLFLMMVVQAGVGFGIKWLRQILYRRTPLWVVQFAGAAALAAAWRFPSYGTYVAAFSVAGVYLGFVYFCAVYYASNDFAHRSRNVGINEFLVGAGSLAGIFVCETWTSYASEKSHLYAACAVGLAVLTVVQVIMAGAGGASRRGVGNRR